MEGEGCNQVEDKDSDQAGRDDNRGDVPDWKPDQLIYVGKFGYVNSNDRVYYFYDVNNFPGSLSPWFTNLVGSSNHTLRHWKLPVDRGGEDW